MDAPSKGFATGLAPSAARARELTNTLTVNGKTWAQWQVHFFAAAREQGLDESSFADVVAGQVRNPGQYPTGGKDELQANMPKDLVKGQDLRDIAVFVAMYAGTDKPPPGGQAGGGGTSGKSIFAANCASCHTLKAAGATGTVGPNLDGLKPSFARAKKQVTNGGAVMPAFKGKLSDKQIDAVARFVAKFAGK